MHLLEQYSLATGAKISSPFILEKFYPLPFDKFITIQNSSGMSGKNYDYFNEVLQLLKPILDKYNINIIHLGLKDDSELPFVYRLCGLTNLGQSAYVIKRGLLHLGNDSSLMHFASGLDKPIVSLFSVSPPSVCGPFFNKNSKIICLEPEFPERTKYSYNPDENPKMVNTIKIERVVNSVLELLNIEENVNIESLYVGRSYKAQIFELIPNIVIDPQQFPNQLFNIRSDLFFDEKNIYDNLSLRKCAIVTKKVLNLDILKQLKQNIEQIIIEIVNDDLLDFIKEIHKTSIKYVLVTFETGESLNQLKFKFLNFNPIIPLIKGKKTEIKSINLINKSTYFATNKVILSNGKIYPSQSHWENNIEASQFNKIIDNNTFWEELEYFYLYNKTN